MIAVTAFNGFLSWVQDSELLALYAIAGGFGTPLLVSTGENHEDRVIQLHAAAEPHGADPGCAQAVVAPALRSLCWNRVLRGRMEFQLLFSRSDRHNAHFSLGVSSSFSPRRRALCASIRGSDRPRQR